MPSSGLLKNCIHMMQSTQIHKTSKIKYINKRIKEGPCRMTRPVNEGFHITLLQDFLRQFPLGCKLLLPPAQMSLSSREPTRKTCLGEWPPSLDHRHAFSPQILWHFLHLALRLQSLATLKTGEAWRRPKQMVFSTHPCNQDPAGEKWNRGVRMA